MNPADDPRAGSRRRRLWQLPPAAHDLLLATGLQPTLLRRTAEQALARLHSARFVLQGSDADVLYSVAHDMATRNAVSEAMQRALDAQHSRALHRVAALREPQALRQDWLAALPGTAVPGTLWALLTHPLGEPLQDALLRDARHWVFEQARAALLAGSQGRADAHERDGLKAEIDRLHLRLLAVQNERDQQHQAAQAELASLRGRLVPAPLLPSPRADAVATAPRLPRVIAIQPAPVSTPAPAPVAQPAPSLQGRRILCVGGMPGAQARYRDIVEAAGARFEFHDGGIEHSVQRLDQQLGAADLVVCQAGCLNHEAYRRVKGHCRRLDKPCLFVERPSLAHFARTLGVAA